jgi:hypothetical protein
MALVDYIAAFGRALASSVDPKTKVVMVQVAGIGSMDPLAPEEGANANQQGEQAEKMPEMGPLGMLWRHLPPGKLDGRTVHADVVCLKTADGLVPVAWRDLRLYKAFPDGLAEGQIAVAGYGKGFYSLTLNADGENIHVIYCPYDFNASGTPAKAHCVILDPDQGVSIAHADGMAITMHQQTLTLRSDTGGARIFMQGDQITQQASKIILQGNVAVGANPAAAVPLLPGAASPPCPSLWLSPV